LKLQIHFLQQITGDATDDIPPPVPLFAMSSASKAHPHNDTTPFPYQQLQPPPPFYGYGYPYHPALPAAFPNHAAPKTKTPSLARFLKDLEEDLGKEEGTFSQFETALSLEEIEVQHIKDLSDQEMIQMGITKIGWRKALRDASTMYK